MKEFDEAAATERNGVLERIRDHVRRGLPVRLPAFDPSGSSGKQGRGTVWEPNEFAGTAGPYLYQFEGEDDLLHLVVTREDGERLTPEEGQSVAAFLLDGVPPAMVWIRPGEYSQHFYLGHELLLSPPTLSPKTSVPRTRR